MKSAIIAMLVVLAMFSTASAQQYMTIEHVGENVMSPPESNDAYIHFYGGHYEREIATTRQVVSCKFTQFACTPTDDYSFIISYPMFANQTILNNPTTMVNDTGKVCIDDGTCDTYKATITIYNMNWRMEMDTGVSLWFFISPNGINVIPTLGLAIVLFLIWHFSQAESKTYRIRQR